MSRVYLTEEDVAFMEKVRLWLKSAPTHEDTNGHETHYVAQVALSNENIQFALFTAEEDWWLVRISDEDG